MNSFEGPTFVRKAEEAISAREEHVMAFMEFNAALPADLTKEWTKQCLDWENDQSKPNPFKASKTSTIFHCRIIPYWILFSSAISDHEVHLQMAWEDAEVLFKGESVQIHDDVSPSMLIFNGLEIEDLQYVWAIHFVVILLKFMQKAIGAGYHRSWSPLHRSSAIQDSGMCQFPPKEDRRVVRNPAPLPPSRCDVTMPQWSSRRWTPPSSAWVGASSSIEGYSNHELWLAFSGGGVAISPSPGWKCVEWAPRTTPNPIPST